MRSLAMLLLIAFAGSASGQSTEPPVNRDAQLVAAEALIDAFYSFDPARLREALSNAPGSATNILYYQGWAEGGNYVVLTRKPCRSEKANEVSCDITVKDDLIGALKTGYDVTDTLHLSFQDGRIVGVRNSSNDPPQMLEAFKWLQRERPDVFTGPCKDLFQGGTTPQDCVRAVVKGFAEFKASS